MERGGAYRARPHQPPGPGPAAPPRSSRAGSPPAPPGSRCPPRAAGTRVTLWTQPLAAPGSGAGERDGVGPGLRLWSPRGLWGQGRRWTRRVRRMDTLRRKPIGTPGTLQRQPGSGRPCPLPAPPPLPGPRRCPAAALGTAPGQMWDRESTTGWLLGQRGPRGQSPIGKQEESRPGSNRRAQQAGQAGLSPQRSQQWPSGRRALWQAAGGQRPPSGWSRAAQTHGSV
jgi:hypothetical protein